MLLVPEKIFSEKLLEPSAVSFSKEFVEECLEADSRVRSPASDFCRNSIFSLTTGFLDSAQACLCDALGSRSDSCQAFGGQCPCKDNVIGRNCTRCKSGYYGFPDCKSKWNFSVSNFEQGGREMRPISLGIGLRFGFFFTPFSILLAFDYVIREL